MEGASVWDAEFGFQEGEPAFCGFLFQNEVFVVGVVFQEVKDGTGGLEGVVGSAVIGHHAEHIVYVAHEAEELVEVLWRYPIRERKSRMELENWCSAYAQ